MYHCINKTSVSRKNKGKQAKIIIFSLYFLNFNHYIVVAIYQRYLIVDSRIDKCASNSRAGGRGCGGARVLYIYNNIIALSYIITDSDNIDNTIILWFGSRV